MSRLEVYIPAHVAQGVDLAFARLGEPKVIMQVKINGVTGKRIDEHRLLLLYLDGEVELDFCDIKSFSDLMAKLDSGSAPSFSFEEQDVSGVVWHGSAEEGTGIVGKVVNAKSLSIRIYFNDYTFEEFKMNQDDLLDLKRKISSEILGL
ncbi:hypothetical protein ACVCMH_17550 (plasmid) [Rhodanobacter sp. UC4439_H6]